MFRLLQRTFFVLFLSSFVFLTAHAQSNELTLQVSPEFPRPNTDVTVRAASGDTDVDVATFTWYVNGKVFQKGKGVTSITTRMGKAGASTRVSVEVAGSNGKNFSKSITLRTSDVVLLWESDGYTPPFYKGKALSTYGSSFTVTAIPEFYTTAGLRINPKTLVYTWTVNGNIDPDQSGYGKDVYKGRQQSYVRGEDEISVIVSTQTDDINSGRKISIDPIAPEVVLYENSPLYGILYENALTDKFFLKSEELTLHASPFDLSSITNNSLTIDWTMNGANVPNFKDKREIVLRTDGSSTGQTTIEFNAQHNKNMMQGGQASITIFQ